MTLVFPPAERDRVGPLGLVFLDGTSERPVPDGLSAVAWREGREDRRASATFNGAGVAFFLGLPRVAAGPPNPFADPNPFVVEVTDRRARYVGGRVVVPAPAKGVTAVTMRSSADRVVPAGLIAFRVELWDAANNRPAAFALLTVRAAPNGNGGGTAGEIIATALADAAGRALALGSWPKPKIPAPGGAVVKWDDQRPLAVEVRYDPAPAPNAPRLDLLARLDRPKLPNPDAPDDRPPLPPVAGVWHRRGATNTPFTAPDLVLGQPMVFQSSGDARGRLLVTPP